MVKRTFPGFAACMRLMRKHSASDREDGFHALLPHVRDYVPELIGEFRSETDHGLRCWLLELLGETRSEDAYPILLEFLSNADESLSHWARVGLQTLDTKEARRALWEAVVPPRPSAVHRSRDET